MSEFVRGCRVLYRNPKSSDANSVNRECKTVPTVDRESETVPSTDVMTVPRDHVTVIRPHLMSLYYPQNTPNYFVSKFFGNEQKSVRKSAGKVVTVGRGLGVDIFLNKQEIPRMFLHLWCSSDDEARPKWYIKNESRNGVIHMFVNGVQEQLQHECKKQVEDGCELKLDKDLVFFVKIEESNTQELCDFEVEILPLQNLSAVPLHHQMQQCVIGETELEHQCKHCYPKAPLYSSAGTLSQGLQIPRCLHQPHFFEGCTSCPHCSHSNCKPLCSGCHCQQQFHSTGHNPADIANTRPSAQCQLGGTGQVPIRSVGPLFPSSQPLRVSEGGQAPPNYVGMNHEQYSDCQLNTQWQNQSEQIHGMVGNDFKLSKPLPLHGPFSIPYQTLGNQPQQPNSFICAFRSSSGYVAQPESAAMYKLQQPLQSSASDRNLTASSLCQADDLKMEHPIQVCTPYPTQATTAPFINSLSSTVCDNELLVTSHIMDLKCKQTKDQKLSRNGEPEEHDERQPQEYDEDHN